MQLKLYQMVDFPTVFMKIRDQNLPFKTSYRLTLLANRIQEHINFYQENFRKLVMEYSKKDENGNPLPTKDGQGILLLDDKINEAEQKITELRELDVELPDITFTPEDFGTIELTPMEMNILLPFIKE